MRKLLPMHTFTKYFKRVVLLFLFLTAGKAIGQNILTEGFENSTFPPTGWASTSQGTYMWTRAGAGAGTNSYGSVSPHGGQWLVYFHNWLANNYSANLITKALPLQNYSASGGFARISIWFFRQTNYGLADNVEVWVNTTQDLNGSPTLLGTMYVDKDYFAPVVSSAGWYPYTFNIPAAYNNANTYVIFKDNSKYEYDSYMDDLSIDWLAPCQSPGVSPPPVALSATPGVINGTVTNAAGSDGTLVVRTVNNTPVAAIPTDGVTYTVGQSFGNGIVVSVGSSTFSNTGIPSSTRYSYTAFSMNSICSGGPKYYTLGTTSSIISAYTGFVSIPVTGFNVDAIANGAAPPASTTDFSALAVPGFDNANDVWTAFDYSFSGNTASCGSFPNGGIIPSSLTTGLSWQLANYTGPNVLMLTTAAPSTAGEIPTTAGTLTLTTPTSTPVLYLLMSAANAGTPPTFNATVNFTDGTNQLFGGLTCPDWTQGTPTYSTAGRVVTTSGSCIGAARLFQQALTISPVNYTKSIKSITFQVTAPTSGNQDLGIFAISGVGTCNAAPSSAITVTTPAITVPICSGTNVTLNTNDPNQVSAAGLLPVWEQATSASGPWTTITTSMSSSANSYSFTTPNLVDSTFYRVHDSCTATGQVGPVSSVFAVPVAKQNFPYLETFDGTANDANPACYVVNDNNGTNWAVRNDIHAADGTAMTAIRANDPASNAAYGKSDFFTLPSFKLTANQVYQIRFKYARGKSDPVGNTGTAYPEHLQIFVNSNAPGYVVNNVTSGTLAFDKTITNDAVNDTTIYISVPSTGGYYISWYSNTAHPGGSSSTSPGGIVIVDSIYMATANCVAPAIVSMPATQNACVGTPVTLSVNASGTANTYQWKKGPVNIPGATASTYTISSPTAADAATYSVVITNPCGSVTTGNTTVLAVNNLPTVSISPSTNASICQGSSYTLTAITNATTPSYQWRRNGGDINGAQSVAYRPDSTGRYRVRVTDISTGCVATSNADTITMLPTPPANVIAGGPTTFCPGSNVTLYANVGSGYTYKWLNGNNVITGQNGSTLSNITAAGQYRVVVTSGTCPDTSTATTVTIATPPNAVITAQGPTSFCAGGSVVLNAPTGNGYTYQGRLNGSLIAWQTSSYQASAPGSYDVIVSIGGDCADTSAPVVVDVASTPQAMMSPVGNVSVCSGDSVALTATAGAGYTYQWIKDGSSLSNTDTGMIYYARSSGNYQVAVKNATGCSDTSSITAITIAAPPTAFIVSNPASGNVCPGASFSLSANTGVGLTYQWQVDGIDIPNATGASYTDNTPGQYNVVVANAGGCKALSAPMFINAIQMPTVLISSSGATSFCSGGSVSLVAFPTSGYMYQWQKNNVNITNATAPSYLANTTGNFNVVVTDPSSGCTATADVPVSVTVNTPPTASISASGNTALCPNTTVVLTGNPTGGGYSRNWYKNGTYYSNQPTLTLSPSDAGSYTLKVYSNTTGCSDSLVSPTVVSAGVGVAAIIAPAGPTTFCEGNSVVLNTNQGAFITYQWYKDGSPVANNTSSYTATATGSYTVKLSNTSCSATSDPVSVVVNPNPTVTVTESGPTTFCSNSNVVLNASTGAGLSYQWQRNGNNVMGNGATTSAYTADTTGVYTVVVTNASGCSTTSAPPVSVTVNSAPSLTINSAGSTTLCAGDTDRLYVNDVPGSYTVQWQNAGNPIGGATSGVYYATASGSYNVKVMGSNGCTGISNSIVVAINPTPNPSISVNGTTLSVNGSYSSYQWYLNGQTIAGANGATYDASETGDYSAFVTDGNCGGMSQSVMWSTTGVNTISKNAIRLYPNPATSMVHIAAPMAVNVSISSLDGRTVLVQRNAKDVDISSLANGSYMVTISDENNQIVKIDKLVKTGW